MPFKSGSTKLEGSGNADRKPSREILLLPTQQRQFSGCSFSLDSEDLTQCNLARCGELGPGVESERISLPWPLDEIALGRGKTKIDKNLQTPNTCRWSCVCRI